MTEEELRAFVAARGPGWNAEHHPEGLACYGCAHAAATEPPPGRPSGERPCATCVRNTEEWRTTELPEFEVTLDDQGNARCFNAAAGFAYNGMPYVHFPMDNYVTMEQRDQERFMDAHPYYAHSVRFHDGKVVVL